MESRRLLLLSLAAALAALAQPSPKVSGNAPNSSGTSNNSLGFSTKNMDLTADPCVDFYQYACGNWMVNNPIPPDQSRWGNFNRLAERNREILRGILEKASVNDPKRDQVTQKIGDFYVACMDEANIEKQGLKPVEPMVRAISDISAKQALPAEIAKLQRSGVRVFFRFTATPDMKNSKMMIADVDQGGLGLPDRDYYLKDDPKSVEIRKQYQAHIQNMFELAGEQPPKAEQDAAAVLKVETQLARAAMDRVARRTNPENTYHKQSVNDLNSLAPFADWQQYMSDMGAPSVATLNIAVPDFFKQLQAAITSDSLDELKAYMRWHVLHNEAEFLPKAFETENFNFYGRVLTGAAEDQPRWKRCVDAVDADLGFALGEKYVDETFGVEGKQRTLKMVQQIEKALGEDIQHLDWMTPETRKEALIKLNAIENKIGYPDKWRDYSTVKIVRSDAVGNDVRATEFEVHRQLNKIGKPVDRSEWRMTPPTVNAYYSPQENNINFPAGILQPPFYDNKMDAAVNYGGIGVVIGHEMTHGFDDQGRQFDPEGNLRDWWTPEDAKEFMKRAQCFIDEYSSFVTTDTVHLNGRLTLGENTADNGGARVAFNALMEALKTNPEPKIDGFTPQQRFFLSFGQIWCENIRPEEARRRATVDPHSTGRYRVNGTVSNMPEFQQAFACRIGQPMVRQPACRVW